LAAAFDAIAGSLCSLEAVHEVRFLVDGDFAEKYGTASVAKAYMDE
jgi:germination protein M